MRGLVSPFGGGSETGAAGQRAPASGAARAAAVRTRKRMESATAAAMWRFSSGVFAWLVGDAASARVASPTAPRLGCGALAGGSVRPGGEAERGRDCSRLADDAASPTACAPPAPLASRIPGADELVQLPMPRLGDTGMCV